MGDGQRLGPWGGGFDQGEGFGGGDEIGESGALGQPLVGDGGGAEREGDQAVPVRGRGLGWGPWLDGVGRDGVAVHQAAKAELGVVLAGQGIVKAVPDPMRHVLIEAGKDKRTLGKGGYRLHQRGGGAARSGGACDDHGVLGRGLCPEVGQAGDGKALAGFGIRCLGPCKEGGDDAEEFAGARPVGGVVGYV